MGTSTAKETLPLLVDQKIPAIGFYTGGEFLRSSMGDVVNFRPSYVQEVASVIEAALAAGVRPQQICAYVQNDEYGMAGIQAMKHQFQKLTGMSETVQKLEQIATMQGTEPVRNDIGPVGVYTRNTLAVKEGYDSLKKWEKKSGTSCQLIATVGTYLAVDKFIGYARYKGEKWVISVASPTNTTSDFVRTLKEQKINGLIATGVVPALDSTLPIVEEARKSLQSQINPVSLEGFIVGKMFLAIMRNIKGDITRSNFIKAVKGQVYDIGGLKLDFTTDNQGSDYVYMSYFNGEEFKPLSPQQFSAIFKP
jgi:hypothetical protein